MTKTTPIRPTVAEFIAERLANSHKTQREIAEECGFEKANVVTMLKSGTMKLPLNRVGAMARALNADPAYLLRLAMCEYLPDAWEAIEATLQTTVLTANELNLVRAYREVTGDNDAQAVVINRDAVIAIVAA